jgi:hypothetical protein
MIGALALSSLSIANAKSYDVTLKSPATAGKVELKAGDYKLKVEGIIAIFTDTVSLKSFSTPVKVQENATKYDRTSVESSKNGDKLEIKSIGLGGSTTKLAFD